MIQSISASSWASPPTPSPSALPSPSGQPYSADWAAPVPSPSPGPAPAPVQSPPTSSTADPDRARESALLADDVYNDVASPPPGFRVASESDLDRLNLTPAMLEQPGSSFRARVYATGSGDDVRYVVAFRGSSAGEDWKNNAQQALGLNSESYAKALRIGKELARSDAEVTITGHSLGGGLASAASIASGREADTFNAAGLHGDTIASARVIAAANGRGSTDVQAYHVPGEILTSLQTGGDRVLGGILLGIPGAILADAPPAYGTSHALPSERPEGVNWFEGLNPIGRHGMDWVLSGVAALR